MPPKPPAPRLHDTRRFRLHYIGHYFLRGILLIAPVLITVTLIYWIFRKMDGWLDSYVQAPGLGFIVLILFIVLVGWISSFFFVRRTFRVVNRALELMPGVSFIYSSVRDFLEAFVGKKRRFTQAVLVNVHADEVWLVGFLTDDTAGNFNLGDQYVSVYVPQAYNVAGQLFVVNRERVRPIENHSPPDVMKYAVTGGAVEIVDKDA